MKIKQVYISDENYEKLKDCNASALVNELLRTHFEKQKITNMSEEELVKFIKIEKLKKEMERIENGN